MFRWRPILLMLAMAGTCAAQVVAPKVTAPAVPPNVDPFNLSFEDFKKYSSMKDFELVGQSYFKVPERTDFAKAVGRAGGEVGSGFNTVRVYDGIAYLAGYNSPPTLFGVLIADVHDPKNMKALSFIPCNPGTRCNYLRVNREKKILIFSHDNDARVGGQVIEQIGSDEGLLGFGGGPELSGESVEVDGRHNGSLRLLGELGEEAGDQPGEDIADAAGR